jgi:hypothetical protein
MTIEAQFTEIIKGQQEDRLIPFLKVLNPDQKKLLVAPIKKLAKEYSQFGSLASGSYGHTHGTDKQRNMLQIASFVCFSLTEYEKSPYSVWMLEENKLRSVIDWYVPQWFSDFVNQQAERDFIPVYLSYNWIMELVEKVALRPSKELLVKMMPQMIFENHEQKWQYTPQNLLKRPITLKEHIWHLFELESNLHYSDRFLYFGKDVSKEKLGWKLVFKQYSADGKIDRQRLLKESLLASNKNFNKVLSGWFAQLFADLEPTAQELLALQKELFSVLSSSHSKVANTALQMIKQLLCEKKWDAEGFLDAVPALLASDTKATVTSTLMIMEKIAKKRKETCEKICVFACGVFVHPDGDLQKRAANLIAGNRESLHEKFHENLRPFHDSLLASAKKILGDMLLVANTTASKVEHFHEKVHKIATTEIAQIPAIQDIDDLVFLASQVFDNNETWHMEQLASALVKFRGQLKSEDISRFEPAFQRALNITKNGLRSNMGYLEHLLAMFFIDFGNYIMRNFPTASESILAIYRKYDQKNGEQLTSWTVSPENSTYTAIWEPYSKITAYKSYQHLLLTAFNKIVRGDDLPLLSEPTHSPGWIMPEILVDRLCAYQQSGRNPDDMDLQIAISRCYLKNTPAAGHKCVEKLSGEFREIMRFLLDENAKPKGPFLLKAAWMVASLTKKEKKTYSEFGNFSYYRKLFNNYTGQLRWESVDEEYTFDRYDYNAKKNVTVKDRRKILRILEDSSEKKESVLKKMLSGLLHTAKEDSPLLYNFLSIKTQWFSTEHNDIKRLLLLVPNNPETMLADILKQSLKSPSFFGESDKKLVIATLQLLHEIWDNYGEMAHLFIGTCMLCSDKTAANIAGEIWINAVSTGKIGNQKLGEVIGLHQRIEFAPLKRFTDLVTQRLFRISDKHNQALQTVIENILKQLPDKPITNLKKLLEIYGELVSINGSSLTDETIAIKLERFGNFGALQKLTTLISQNLKAGN